MEKIYEKLLDKHYLLAAISTIAITGLGYIGNKPNLLGDNYHFILIFLNIINFIVLVIILNVIATKLNKLLNKFDNNLLENKVDSIGTITASIVKIITQLSEDTQNTIQILSNINNAVKGIPNKAMLLQITQMRTKGLIFEILEIAIEYGYAIQIGQDKMVLLSSGSRFDNGIKKIIDSYVEDILKTSKGTIKPAITTKICDMVCDTIVTIKDIMEQTSKIDEKIIRSTNTLRDMENSIAQELKIALSVNDNKEESA